MLARGYFSHTSPGGKAFYRWVDSTGYEYSAVAENLAVNLNMISAPEMISSWLNSPGHRANLLSSAYTEAGMGVSHGVYQGQEAVFAVHVFAHPKNRVVAKTASSVPVAAAPINNVEKPEVAPVVAKSQKSVPVKSVKAKPVVKNVDVLGEAISTVISSPELATEEKRPEIIATSTAPEIPVDAKSLEAHAQKSLFKKILDFLSSL
jgi:hypothetical protein